MRSQWVAELIVEGFAAPDEAVWLPAGSRHGDHSARARFSVFRNGAKGRILVTDHL